MKSLYSDNINLEVRFKQSSQSEALHANVSKLESNLAEYRSQLEYLKCESLANNQQLQESSSCLHQESAK